MIALIERHASPREVLVLLVRAPEYEPPARPRRLRPALVPTIAPWRDHEEDD